MNEQDFVRELKTLNTFGDDVSNEGPFRSPPSPEPRKSKISLQDAINKIELSITSNSIRAETRDEYKTLAFLYLAREAVGIRSALEGIERHLAKNDLQVRIEKLEQDEDLDRELEDRDR